MTDVLATFGSDLWEEITMWICLSKAEGSQCAAWSCSRSEHPPPRQEGDLAVSLRPQPWKWHGVTFALCCLSAESLDSRDNGQGHRLPLLMGRICKNLEAAFQDYHMSLNVISSEKSCRPSPLKYPCPLLKSLSIMIPL